MEMGYHPCIENILYDLTFCDPMGINISTPSEVCMHFTWSWYPLLNAFARFEKEQKEQKKKKKKNDGEEEEEQDTEEEEEENHQKRRR